MAQTHDQAKYSIVGCVLKVVGTGSEGAGPPELISVINNYRLYHETESNTGFKSLRKSMVYPGHLRVFWFSHTYM